MPDWQQKVTRGSRVQRPNADMINGAIDAARKDRRERFQSPAAVPEPDLYSSQDVIRVASTSTNVLDRFAVLQLGGPLINPDDNLTQWQNFPNLAAATVTNTAAPFCITLDPLTGNGVGRGVVSGAVPCQVDVTNASHGYAGPTVDETGYLTSAPAGPCKILWKPSGTGTLWCLVLMLPAPESGPGCVAVLTSNVALTGLPSPADGVTIADGYPVLLEAQASPSQNGPWIVSSAGPWARPSWYPTGGSISPGFVVGVAFGDVYADTVWVMAPTELGVPVIVDTDATTWVLDALTVKDVSGTPDYINTKTIITTLAEGAEITSTVTGSVALHLLATSETQAGTVNLSGLSGTQKMGTGTKGFDSICVVQQDLGDGIYAEGNINFNSSLTTSLVSPIQLIPAITSDGSSLQINCGSPAYVSGAGSGITINAFSEGDEIGNSVNFLFTHNGEGDQLAGFSFSSYGISAGPTDYDDYPLQFTYQLFGWTSVVDSWVLKLPYIYLSNEGGAGNIAVYDGASFVVKLGVTGTDSIGNEFISGVNTKLGSTTYGTVTEITAGTGLSGGGTTGDVTISISGTYAGQTSITTLGTIGTGTWQGSEVGVAYGGTGSDLATTGPGVIGQTSTGSKLQPLTSISCGSN